MATKQPRLEIHIDVLEKSGQQAHPLASLTPTALIQAILDEFRGEINYLGDVPDAYELHRADSGTVLVPGAPLGQQIENGAGLRLVEREMTLPPSTQRPAQRIYLREQNRGKVYKLNWLPALIGRPHKSMDDNDLLAVNLESYVRGGHVSRRHAQIRAEDGRFVLEVLADNPVHVVRDFASVPVGDQPYPLQHADIITLERSGIDLQLIILEA
ncbi:FHA domain-containing protein [bacterium]|nr:FHA domain-containing protein [bacterium]